MQHEVDPAKAQGGARYQPIALEDFRLLQREIGSFSQVAATQVIRVLWRGDRETRRIDGEMVSAGYFEFSGVPLALGRGFLAEEDQVPDAGRWRCCRTPSGARNSPADKAVLGRGSSSTTILYRRRRGRAGFHCSNSLNPADLRCP